MDTLFQKLRWGAARHDGLSVDLSPDECRAVLDLIEPPVSADDRDGEAAVHEEAIA